MERPLEVDEKIVAEKVAKWLVQRAGSARNFSALVADPAGSASLTLTDQSLPFARLTAAMLRNFGFDTDADRLTQQIEDFKKPVSVPPVELSTDVRQRKALIIGVDETIEVGDFPDSPSLARTP